MNVQIFIKTGFARWSEMNKTYLAIYYAVRIAPSGPLTLENTHLT